MALCFLGVSGILQWIVMWKTDLFARQLPAVLEGIEVSVLTAVGSVASKELQSGLVNTAQSFTLATMSAPGFAKAMWPQGNTQSQSYQEAQLDQMLEQARDQIGDRLNAGLGTLMTDPGQFVLFAGQGRYSGQVPLSVPQQTDSLALSLKTLLTGESLLQNNWYANAGWSSEIGTALGSTSGCNNTGSNIWDCKDAAYYYSDSTGRYYAFRNKKGGTKNSVNVLQQISSNGWADMNALFDGGYNCTFEGECYSSRHRLGTTVEMKPR